MSHKLYKMMYKISVSTSKEKVRVVPSITTAPILIVHHSVQNKGNIAYCDVQ